MLNTVMFWGMRAFEVLFFSGLIGCVLVVAVSWVSIARSSFSKGAN